MPVTKSNLSLKEITEVLEKSGASFGSSFNMRQNAMGVEQGVRSNVYGAGQPVLDNAMKNYLAQLAKVAEMDQKLAGVYGDPTSPLYIERASRRDSAVHMADAPNYNAAATHADTYESKKKELEDSIKQTMAVYDELTQLTKAQEQEAEKQARDDARVKAGRGQYIETETGQKIVVPKYKGKSSSSTSKNKLTEDQRQAGFKDPDAGDYWSNKDAKFKKEWKDKVLSGKANPPKGGYTKKDIDVRYNAWKKKNPDKKSKKASEDQELLKTYIESQKKKQGK